eukprot:TRINITY_DN25055_c0_g1_i1.p1 TRINITY_DN25055_c0_g1~~TRINITY_DN25055_c0_g1_i1.p1  ORF type:complete len:240 (-),score=41.09 TRINITY_DN25055_c0_g1_i1:17-736(-)
MDAFAKDCLRVGVLQGFQHFSVYLRGREELVVSVKNSQSKLRRQQSYYYAPFRVVSHGLPPASPSARAGEKTPLDDTCGVTEFLIGGYARYKCPYVWLRSNEMRLGTVREGDEEEEEETTSTENKKSKAMELPLELRSVEAWKENSQAVKVSDIIEELVMTNMHTPPSNPFAVDLSYMDDLPLRERVLLTGSLANFLRELYMRGKTYKDSIRKDLESILERHFFELTLLLRDSSRDHTY